jgi:hypothetical protein
LFKQDPKAKGDDLFDRLSVSEAIPDHVLTCRLRASTSTSTSR